MIRILSIAIWVGAYTWGHLLFAQATSVPEWYITREALAEADTVALARAEMTWNEVTTEAEAPLITFDSILDLRGQLPQDYWQYPPLIEDAFRPDLENLGPRQPTLMLLKNSSVIAYHQYLRPLSDEEIQSITLDNLIPHVLRDIAMARGPNMVPVPYKGNSTLQRYVPGHDAELLQCTCENECPIRFSLDIDDEGQPSAVELLTTPFEDVCNDLAVRLVQQILFVPGTDANGRPTQWNELVLPFRVTQRYWLFDPRSE